jgi:hypothetical protein
MMTSTCLRLITATPPNPPACGGELRRMLLRALSPALDWSGLHYAARSLHLRVSPRQNFPQRARGPGGMHSKQSPPTAHTDLLPRQAVSGFRLISIRSPGTRALLQSAWPPGAPAPPNSYSLPSCGGGSGWGVRRDQTPPSHNKSKGEKLTRKELRFFIGSAPNEVNLIEEPHQAQSTTAADNPAPQPHSELRCQP